MTTSKAIYGGRSDKGEASNNIVKVAGDNVILNSMIIVGYGNSNSNGNANNNQFITEGNNITINNTWLVVGEGNVGNANNNKLILDCTPNSKMLYVVAGRAFEGTADKNTIEIKDGNYTSWVIGGYAVRGSAKENNIAIEGGTFYTIWGARSDTANAENNTVIISGGNTVVKSHIYGAEASNLAKNNAVTISEATIDGSNLENAISIRGGYGSIAEGNTVNIENEANLDNVNIYGGHSKGGNSANNTINLTGGSVNGNVYGGYYSLGNYQAIGNTVNIWGDVNLEQANIYGGGSWSSSNETAVGAYAGASNPNTLNIGVNDTGNISAWYDNTGKVKSLQGFDKINFNYFEWIDGAAVIDASEKIELSPNGTEITVGTIYTPVNKEESMELLKLSGDGKIANLDKVILNDDKIDIATVATITKGVDYNITPAQDGKSLILEISPESSQGSTTINPQTLVIGEARTAATSFTNMGSEMVEAGLDALARQDNKEETKVYAGFGGNASRFATGSHVKVNGWNGVVAVGKEVAEGLTVGAFFETGEGNFRTYNALPSGLMRGDGEANYNGGGLLVRKETKNGLYLEGSLRAGLLKNSLTNAVMTSSGLAGYDVETSYYGAQVGLGKIIQQGEGTSLDIYGKYMYTHHSADTFTIDGAEFAFDSINSQRIRLGLRQTVEKSRGLKLYYGAAWEYEFDGDAKNKVVGYDLSTPSLGGSTVIGEVGAHYALGKKWELDLNLRGYAGQREGVSTVVNAAYKF